MDVYMSSDLIEWQDLWKFSRERRKLLSSEVYIQVPGGVQFVSYRGLGVFTATFHQMNIKQVK